MRISNKFSDKLYKICKKIPKGKITTYKEIAKAIKTKNYRAIGQVLKKNSTPCFVPCHRVVRSDGYIGGYFGNKKVMIEKKKILLRKEGIKIKGNKIENFSSSFFSFR